MRVFLDGCIDPRAAALFGEHEVKTAFQLNWHRLRDHTLLSLVEKEFDVLVTIDQGFEFEHNLKKLPMGIVIVHVARNKVEFYRALAPQLLEAIVRVQPGEVVHIRGNPRGTK